MNTIETVLSLFTTTYIWPGMLSLAGIVVIAGDIFLFPRYFLKFLKEEVLWFIIVCGGVALVTGLNLMAMQLDLVVFLGTMFLTIACLILSIPVFFFPISRKMKWGYAALDVFNLIILGVGISQFLEIRWIIR